MFVKKSTIIAGAFTLGALAAPVTKSSVTAENLIAIAPETASCSGATYADECADATKAAAALSSAFAKYEITTPGEQAAIVAYTLFESGNYKYNKNHFPAPGRPGQGTRMMAMPPFVKQYATAIAGASAVSGAEATGGDAGLNAILALANADDEKSFGSAAWFLTTQCKPEIRSGLASEETAGWHAFLTECVGTTATSDRDDPWMKAKQVIRGSAGDNNAPAASSAAGTPAQSKPTTQPAAQPPVAQPVAPTPSAAESASAVAPTTSAAPAPAQPTQPAPAQPSTVTAPVASPALPTPSAAAPVAPSPVAPAPVSPPKPSGTGTGTGNAPSNPGSLTGTCSPAQNGAVVCNGEKKFGLCNNGNVVWQDVAAGTACANGVISRRAYRRRVSRRRV